MFMHHEKTIDQNLNGPGNRPPPTSHSPAGAAKVPIPAVGACVFEIAKFKDVHSGKPLPFIRPSSLRVIECIAHQHEYGLGQANRDDQGAAEGNPGRHLD